MTTLSHSDLTVEHYTLIQDQRFLLTRQLAQRHAQKLPDDLAIVIGFSMSCSYILHVVRQSSVSYKVNLTTPKVTALER